MDIYIGVKLDQCSISWNLNWIKYFCPMFWRERDSGVDRFPDAISSRLSLFQFRKRVFSIYFIYVSVQSFANDAESDIYFFFPFLFFFYSNALQRSVLWHFNLYSGTSMKCNSSFCEQFKLKRVIRSVSIRLISPYRNISV